MANGMAALYVGASGVRSNMNALNTTANNLANVNTTGYTRQQVVFDDTAYNTVGRTDINTLKVGLGVDVQDVRRVRDDFLDRAYRTEVGRRYFYETQYDALTEIEEQFGELEGVKFQDYMEDLKASIQEVAKNPNSTVTRASLVQSASAFLDKANAVHSGLVDYQNTLNIKVEGLVKDINELGEKISKLNTEIASIEFSGQTANDLRDQRDQAIDKLGRLVNITYDEKLDGAIDISIEGIPFIEKEVLFPMGVAHVGDNSLSTPVWTHLNNREVFTLNVEINTDKGNDVGELKGVLLARGSYVPNHTDIPNIPLRNDYASDADYEAAYEAYKVEAEHFYKNIEPSVVMKALAGLDKLVNSMVESINNVLCPNKTIEIDGVEYTVLDTDKAGCGTDDEHTIGEELFSRMHTKRYVETEINGETYYVYNNINYFGNESLYTIGNLEINPNVLTDYSKIPLSTELGEENFKLAEELVSIWDDKNIALKPDVYGRQDFDTFYMNMVSDLANTGEVLVSMAQGQESMALELDNRRQQPAGVSSDEELTNMIRFQNAYNAASRYVNVVSEMLEHLIERL
ncbi:MAG: flagellar hook-associated protein FlgK [Lachnospiraceae bacterium]|nr:flagellar hook-associated protein FlgK [Lachnospiraceae bacterium]